MSNEKTHANEHLPASSVPTQPEPPRTAGNLSESGAASAKDVLEPAPEIEKWQARGDAARQLVRKMLLPRLNPRPGATGPRTKTGKKRSRYNALKHGIFSRALVAAYGETMVGFEFLLADFRNYFQPEGAVEELLVEKLAILIWRYRRLLLAEKAEIQYQLKMAACNDGWDRDLKALSKIEQEGVMMPSVESSSISVLKLSIKELKGMQEKIQKEGLHWERDLNALFKLYGRGPDHRVYESPYTHKRELLPIEPEPRGLLAQRYRDLTLQEQSKSNNPTSADPTSDSSKSVLELIAEQIQFCEERLKRLQKEVEPRITHGFEASVVPAQDAMERLQRYEVSLDRAFDRTLSQLERLKRMRLGHPVAPRIQVDVSH